MKRDEPFHDIDALLRSQQPDPLPSPGLESRILRALQNPPRRSPARWWPWLLLPTALASAVLMLKHPAKLPQTASPIAHVEAPAEIQRAEPALSDILSRNPLKDESQRLATDAKRAGEFLVSFLPSIGSETE